MPQTILATDLDGTFLGGSAAEREALYNFIEQHRRDLVLIYVSGRSLTTMQDVLQELPVQPDHIIADVGTSFLQGPERRPHAEVEAWLDDSWCWTKAGQVREWIAEHHPNLQPQPIVEGRRLSYFYAEPLHAEAIRPTVHAQGLDWLTSDNRYLDVLPRGVQKGPTLLKALKALGLEPDRTLVAGDTLNDLSMFATGLHGVAVGNSEASLLAALAQGAGPRTALAQRHGAGGVLDHLKPFHLQGAPPA